VTFAASQRVPRPPKRPTQRPTRKPVEHRLRVLYEDNHCLVVFKPAGVLTAPDRTGDVSLLDEARRYLREKFHKPGRVYLGLVHRLDRPVSGVVLFARTSKAAGRLSEQFRAGRVEKVYQALVEGRLSAPSGTQVDHLVKDRRANVVRRAADAAGGGRASALDWRRLKPSGGATLVEIRPRTGRSHQIRVQMSALGHPILGDRKYGSRQPFANGIALCAVSLTFEHPVLKEPIRVDTVPPW
jgi:23S rRNA pseudouridine1911/1915/1917 synthase